MKRFIRRLIAQAVFPLGYVVDGNHLFTAAKNNRSKPMPSDTKPALVWSSKTNRFALVSHELGTSMLHVGNTEGFDRLTTTAQPKEIRIEQIRSGLCAVRVVFIGIILTHESKRCDAKRLARQLSDWTKAPVFNVKAGGTVVRVDNWKREPNKAPAAKA